MSLDSIAGGGPAGSLSLQVVNAAGGVQTPNVIFITSDASYNQVSLQIVLTAGSTTLSPGTIPDPDGPPPTVGTTLYLDLRELKLSSDAWKALTVTGTDWKFQTFPAQGVLGLTPARAIPLAPGTSGAITIGIGGIVVPQPLAKPQVQLYVTYYGIPNVQGTYATLPVAVQNRPDDKSKPLSEAITVALSANGIVNSIVPLLKAANKFSLQFVGSEQVQPPSAKADTVFTVTFVYGAPNDAYGFGALTDITNATAIKATAGSNAAKWGITQNKDAQSTSWTLQPPQGAPIVGAGELSVVAIDFANVVTTYQPGPTMILISYANVPGYRDGTFSLVLDKVPHAVIHSLAVTPNPACFSGGKADVTVSWKVDDAQQGLTLTQNFSTAPVTGTQTPATLVAERTVFALKATGAAGTVENADYRSVSAIALPVINSFAGFPTEVYSGTLSHDVTLAWAVDTTELVALSSTGGAFSGQNAATATITQAIDQPQMVTLAPVTAANPLTLTRRLVISAFTPTPQNYPLAFTPAAVAASPTGPFLVLAGPANSLTVADTVQYGAAAAVAIGHPAAAIAFSPDGATVVTANTDQTVSVLGVTLDATGMPQFGAPSTINLTAAPQQLVFSPKGPRIFVTVDPGAGKAGQVVSLLGSGGSYRIEATVNVGMQPRGLALDAAGARLFVANSGDDTVSMLGLTTGGALGGATTIQGLTGGPTGIAATPSGQQLLVSCATAGTVVVIDPSHPDFGQRKTLTVGKTPGPIAVTPSGAYAFVANRGDGTVSLLNCWALPSQASVLGTAIAVAAQPTALAMSPDGLQVLVANSGGFTLVTLATYRTSPTAPSIPLRPTSLAASPDGGAVFAWHDAGIPAHAPSPGVLVYAPGSGVSSNLLADKDVLRLEASPDPHAKEAFAIVRNDPALYCVATDTLETSTLALGLAAGSAPIALAVSGDGLTVFLVVADASHNLSLLVLGWKEPTWSPVQTLKLYRAKKAGRILLRSTPDGTTVLLVDVEDDRLRVIRQTGGSYALSDSEIVSPSKPLDLAILPDGSTAYVLNASRTNTTITVVDVASLKSHVAAIPQTYVSLNGLQPSPDGRRLFATDTNAAALRMLDPRSLRILQTIKLSSDSNPVAHVMGLAVLADGSKIFTANQESQNLSVVEQIQMGAPPAASRLLRATALSALASAYTGLFVRHQLGETPSMPTKGWCFSPDVIAYGPTIEPDKSVFTSEAGYAKDLEKDVPVCNPNQIYIRGLNTTNATITSRAYFFFTASALALWPSNWRSDGVTFNTAPQYWVDIEAPANDRGVNPTALVWTPPPLPPGSDHYCIGAWIENGRNPQPPDFAAYSKFATLDDLIQFVLSHHNLAWRNTNVVTAPPPDYAYNVGIEMKEGGGTVGVYIAFANVPSDGCFAVNLKGPDPDNSIALPKSPLSKYEGGYQPPGGLLSFPSNFKTAIQVYHWPGKTPLPPNAKITVTLDVDVAPSMVRDIERMYRPLGLRTPFRRGRRAILGSMHHLLKFGAARA